MKLNELKGKFAANRIIIYYNVVPIEFIERNDHYYREDGQDLFDIFGDCIVEVIYGEDEESINIDIKKNN